MSGIIEGVLTTIFTFITVAVIAVVVIVRSIFHGWKD